MNRYVLLTIAIMLSSTAFAQIVKHGQVFETVSEIEGKVIFLKEIATNKESLHQGPYNILQGWVRGNYGKDHFYSSMRFDDKNREAVVKSRVELILPEDSKGVREKMMMRFRLNAFIFQDKCVVEIENIAFIQEGNQKFKIKMPRVINAEDFITDSALAKDDEFKELRANTRKATIFFLNELTKDLGDKFVDEPYIPQIYDEEEDY